MNAFKFLIYQNSFSLEPFDYFAGISSGRCIMFWKKPINNRSSIYQQVIKSGCKNVINFFEELCIYGFKSSRKIINL